MWRFWGSLSTRWKIRFSAARVLTMPEKRIFSYPLHTPHRPRRNERARGGLYSVHLRIRHPPCDEGDHCSNWWWEGGHTRRNNTVYVITRRIPPSIVVNPLTSQRSLIAVYRFNVLRSSLVHSRPTVSQTVHPWRSLPTVEVPRDSRSFFSIMLKKKKSNFRNILIKSHSHADRFLIYFRQYSPI